MGDPRQLPEVEAGGAFAALVAALPAVHLSDNRRQTEAWERAALGELRAGAVGKAVTAYRDHQRITIADTAETARARLVADWWAARQDGANASMYALRRSDVDDLNRRARLQMAEAGRLVGEPVIAAGRRFAVGDEVLASRNDRRLGVRNGTRGQVVAVDHQHHSVTIGTNDGQHDIVLPADYLDAGYLGYGYATTVHKAQGATVDRAFVLGSDALYREAGYVALSRARARSDLYIVNTETDDLDHHRRGHDDERDPITRLAGELARFQAQQLASQPAEAQPPTQATPLADLEDEQAQLRRRIGQQPPLPDRGAWQRLQDTQAARRTAEHHLQEIDRLPRRQRAGARAVAEDAWEVARVAERRAGDDLARAEDEHQARQRWLADNAQPLARYRQLGEQITEARRTLEAVALADPAPHHLDTLGPPPVAGPGRHRWAAAAADLDAYRQRWQIGGPESLGPDPDDDTQARHRLQHAIDSLRRHLDRDRSIDQGLGL